MLTLLLMACLAHGGTPDSPREWGNRAAIGVVVGEFYGGVVIGLGGWWLSSQLTPTEGLNDAIVFTAPAGAAIGGVLGGAIAGGPAWAPVSGAAAVPISAGLAVTALGASRGNRQIAAVGVSLMVVGAPLASRTTAIHLAKKRRDTPAVVIVPTLDGFRLQGRW